MSQAAMMFVMLPSKRRRRVVLSNEDMEEFVRRHPLPDIARSLFRPTDDAPTHEIVCFGIGVLPIPDLSAEAEGGGG